MHFVGHIDTTCLVSQNVGQGERIIASVRAGLICKHAHQKQSNVKLQASMLGGPAVRCVLISIHADDQEMCTRKLCMICVDGHHGEHARKSQSKVMYVRGVKQSPRPFRLITAEIRL